MQYPHEDQRVLHVVLYKGAILKKTKRKAAREQILAYFQFYINGHTKDIFEGMTLNISQSGFGFLTERAVKEGQSITITKLAGRSPMQDITDQQARVIWVKQGRRFIEAGVELNPGS